MLSMQREINRMFDNFFRGDLFDGASLLPSTWSPAADIAERENDYVVKVELPGVNKEDVRITLEDDTLTIRGEKKQEKETKDAGYRRLERSYGSFERSFALPTSVKVDNIDAAYKEGVLTITLPKAEDAKPKQIEVKVK
jgi:HSP20 family protein